MKTTVIILVFYATIINVTLIKSFFYNLNNCNFICCQYSTLVFLLYLLFFVDYLNTTNLYFIIHHQKNKTKKKKKRKKEKLK